MQRYKHDIWLEWPFAFLRHLDRSQYGEKNTLNATFGAKKPKCRWVGPLGEVVNWNFTKREQNWQFFLCALCQYLFAPCYFGACFGTLAGVQNVAKWACWKPCPVCFLTPLEFLNFVLIFPSKYPFSQDCFLCVKKVAERPFFGCFWPLGDSDHTQTITFHTENTSWWWNPTS